MVELKQKLHYCCCYFVFFVVLVLLKFIQLFGYPHRRKCVINSMFSVHASSAGF